MLDWLDRQRQKTKAERTRLALFIAVLCTAVIALLWFFTIPAQFQDFGKPPEGGGQTDDGTPAFDRNSIERAIDSVQQQYAPGTTTPE